VNVQARVDAKIGGPPSTPRADHVVIATVIVNGVRSATFTSSNPTSFTVDGQPPAFPGPFVIALPSGDNGLAELDFTQAGLVPGDQVRLNVEAVIPIVPGSYDPQNPDFTVANPMGHWDLPSTPATFRALELTL
jgi:hypothetical protein